METLKFTSNLVGKHPQYPEGFTLPDFIRDKNGKIDRNACLTKILDEEYGYVLSNGVELSVTEMPVPDWQQGKYSLSGKANHITFNFEFTKENKKASFKVDYFTPKKYINSPLAVFINFGETWEHRYFPAEEVIDEGLSVAYFYYQDVTTDDDDFTTGLAPLLVDRSLDKCAGKVAVWAYAMNTVCNYFIEKGFVTKDKTYAVGHSRLGKTALLACALNENFAGCLTNCSGCSGAAISKNKTGEDLEAINRVFPFWFTPSFNQYSNNENSLTFDQHYLIGAIAPRTVCINAAEEDTWADTNAQYLCAEAGSVAYEEMGLVGLDKSVPMIRTGEQNITGNIKFLKSFGTHYLGRYSWHFLIDSIKYK